MRSLPLKAVVLMSALALAGAACSKSNSANGPTSPPSSASPSESPSAAATITIDGKTANNKGTEDLAGKSTFTLKLDNDKGVFYFEPTVLVGTPGEKITLVLQNVGSTKHNFTLEDQNLNVDLGPGKDHTVTVTFPQSGTLEFHCEYHQAIGMIGEIQVSG